jgi:hypothetical protein
MKDILTTAELDALDDAADLAAELAAAPEAKPLSELLDETGIAAAKILAEHFGPLGLHALVIVTDAGGQQFSFRSATLGPNATYGLLCRVKALAKRFYCSF